MKVNEIFKAIQGEGKTAGYPTVFLRLCGCNLKCDFCDTKYHTEGSRYSIEEVKRQIQQYGMRDITITGGEPMLPGHRDEIFALTRMMPGRNFYLETNGTQYDDRMKQFAGISCSPKKQAIDIPTLKQLSKLENLSLKFVFESKNDLWWEEVLTKAQVIKLDNVYIMPEGATREEQLGKMPEVMEYCQQKGFKFSPRLHVLAYNTRRGV